MSTAAAKPATQAPARPVPRVLRFLSHHLLTVVAVAAMAYLLAPIVMMAILSFNQVEGRFNFVWHSFSLEGWLHPFAIGGILPALGVSLAIAAVSALVSTVLGTMLAYAQVRYDFRGQRALDLILLLTISTPEVIIGSSLLNLFLDLRIPTGGLTIALAHIMFNIAFTTIVVKSRLRSFDLTLEQAAQDLGARGGRIFRRITLPLILPAVVMAGLLAFMLSLDDFIISMFVSGQTVTFPLFVWGQARIAMPTQIYVIGTGMFLILTTLLLLVFLMERRSQRTVGA